MRYPAIAIGKYQIGYVAGFLYPFAFYTKRPMEYLNIISHIEAVTMVIIPLKYILETLHIENEVDDWTEIDKLNVLSELP